VSAPVSEFTWTAKRFEQAGDAGVIPAHADLIEGVVYIVSPQGPAHARVVRALQRASRDLDERFIVGVQLPVQLGPATEPEPDLYIAVGPEERYLSAHPGAEDLELVVEVSDTTLAYDLTTKLDIYRRHHLKELWVIDLAGRRALRYAPIGAEAQVLSDGVLSHASGLGVDLGGLW
jgi:Uma2 family endonuclease